MNRFIYILCIIFPLFGFGQVKSIGTPYIRNYPKSEYNAGTQNWGVAQDDHGFMYFANNDGVLRFDGIQWDLIQVSQSSPVRSICIDQHNNIYVGMFNDFGILKKNKMGRLYFQSLRNLLPPDIKNFDDIWKIHDIRQGIAFQSFDYLFILRDNKIKVIKPKNRYHFSFSVGDRFFMHEPGVGLFEYINGIIDKVPWSEELTNMEIRSILEIHSNYLLIATSRNGIYIFENGKLEKWNTPVNELVEKYKLFSSAKLKGDYFVFGTILNGIITSDSDGEIVQHINKNRGLQNNTILSIYPDDNDNLWLGLDNGIDYVEINSPLSYISNYEGLSAGYCARVFEDKLYLGTNQGLFVKSFNNFSGNDEKFELVENTAGQVWSLHILDGQLICGHHLGTFIIKGNKSIKISEEEGGWDYIPLQDHPDLILGGHYTGLVIFKKGPRGWEFRNKIKGFNESSRFISQSEDGSVWMSHGAKGIYRIRLNEELDSVLEYKTYTSKNGLPSDERNILIQFKDKEYISTINGIYEYLMDSDSFAISDELTRLFNVNGRIRTVETDSDGNIWFVADNESGVLRLNEDLTYTKITAPFKPLDGKFVNEFEFIYPYNNDHIFIGIENGFAHYSSKFPKSYLEPFQSYITKIELPYIDSTIYLTNLEITRNFEFPFKKNAFRFSYTAPFYENQDQQKFSYILQNYIDDWSDWTANSYKDFTNLPEGDYIFQVKAINIYGVESGISTFKFRVIPPWHRSKVAYYTYFLLFLLLLFLTIKFVLHRMELSRKREFEKHQLTMKEQEEKFQHQALVAEKEIIKLRNDKLRSEMIYRDKELANQTMSIIQKNKFLVKLKDELQRIQKSTTDAQLKAKFSAISKRINKEIDNKQQNQIFEAYFDEVHEDFFERLKQEFPQLSPREMRLCAYIRMNLTSKEIAVLLNISDRGIEISRYRLRKKLELPRETNLSTFLSHI